MVLIPRWDGKGDELFSLNQPASLLDGWRDFHSRYIKLNLHTISKQRCKTETLDACADILVTKFQIFPGVG